jgi:CHAT domain-containing protein
VARWLTLTNTRPNPLRRQVTMRMLCPVVPPSNLPAAQLESQYMTSLPARWPPLTLYNPLPRSADEVRAVMAAGRVNLFHIATHGNFQVSDPTNAAIQIGTSQLTPASLTGNPIANGFTAGRPLVFINACHSGRQGLALSGLGGWVDRVVQLGASGFIGTNWEVQDDLAAQFAIRFYDYLRMGSTFGTACRLARQEIRQANPGNSTWLAYVLYAHPLGTLQVPAT